jgi:membrane protease YdiL (CAAX protease family)
MNASTSRPAVAMAPALPALAAPLSWPSALALHLGPGVALVLFFLAAGPAFHRAGLPPLWGLLSGVLVVVVPIELGLVARSLRSRGIRLSWSALGLGRIHQSDLLPLVIAGAACLVAPGLVIGLEPILDARIFGWLPDWFSAGIHGLSAYPPGVEAATLALWFLSVVIVGPAVEEIYFRGWLLPQLPGSRWMGCTTHTALFAVYHLWQPQAWLTVFLFALPLTALAITRRKVTLSVIVHCGVNIVTFAALLTGAMQR